ncbi:uncharacterized protein BT62DRAFT_1070986 [Guyanagaster necrorhizus]|uniref:Uncharacterized protein n=1 Tax=Guyanagaster necrorhizus TaxID=856835 RepID=A0A9P8AY06_9AGAR|nr:uncharacterized protein BT62DRAFT_1070986 [Guyanagaster necrorhizus MCA 3950]KAG7451761.1 hypothetical protein BT62DRAFT_1070986 [Guyanagaster necrorhizus MCA 3950]
MCEYSDTIPPPGELIDPLFLEIFLELEYLKRRLVVVTTSSELAITLESIKDAIARCKDYQLKESLIRELAAEIVDLKVTVRNRSGEDCDEYRMLVLQEKWVDTREDRSPALVQRFLACDTRSVSPVVSISGQRSSLTVAFSWLYHTIPLHTSPERILYLLLYPHNIVNFIGKRIVFLENFLQLVEGAKSVNVRASRANTEQMQGLASVTAWVKVVTNASFFNCPLVFLTSKSCFE